MTTTFSIFTFLFALQASEGPLTPINIGAAIVAATSAWSYVDAPREISPGPVYG